MRLNIVSPSGVVRLCVPEDRGGVWGKVILLSEPATGFSGSGAERGSTGWLETSVANEDSLVEVPCSNSEGCSLGEYVQVVEKEIRGSRLKMESMADDLRRLAGASSYMGKPLC